MRLPGLKRLLWLPVLACAAAARAASSETAGGFEVGLFTGLALDSFAGGDVGRLLDPGASGDIRSRPVAGLHFDFPVWKGRGEKPFGLALYGETVYGVRSALVDCQKEPNLDACRPFTPTPSKPLHLIRNATSLEGLLGFRLHLVPVGVVKPRPASLYLKGEAGFLAISGVDDLASTYKGAVGLMAMEGRYKGSYLEAGLGGNEVFGEDRHGRLVLDTQLTWQPGLAFLKDFLGAAPFIQLTVDSDLAGGPDSVQTFLGLVFDVDHLLGKTP